MISLLYYANSLRQVVSEQGKFPVKMSGDGSSGGGHIPNVVKDVEALRTEVQAQRAVLDTMDQRFRRFEQRFDDLVERFDAMGTNTNRDGDAGGVRPRAEHALGVPINRPIAANPRIHDYDVDSNGEDDWLIRNHRPALGRRPSAGVKGLIFCFT